MLRSVVKIGIKTSILAAEKIKYALGCLKEDIEDITAEVKAELQVKHQHATYHAEQESTHKQNTPVHTDEINSVPQNISSTQTKNREKSTVC